jgi:hypothetical protein
MAGLVPSIEIPDDGDFFGVGRPDRELGAVDTTVPNGVSTKLIVKPKMPSFIEKVDIVVRQKTHRCLITHYEFIYLSLGKH